MNDPANTTWPASSASRFAAIQRQLANLLLRFFRLMQPLGGQTDIVF
jgi:hypothetical protein